MSKYLNNLEINIKEGVIPTGFMIFKQSVKNHIIVAEFSITTTAILFGAWWYFNYDPDILFIGGLFQLIFTIPALYLHAEYCIRNWGQKIEINNNEIIVNSKDKLEKYSFGDFKEILIYKSASLDKYGIPFSAIEYYCYARLITKGGEEIFITCLMNPKLKNILENLNPHCSKTRSIVKFCA